MIEKETMEYWKIIEAEADWLKTSRENNAAFHPDNPNKKSPEFLAGMKCAEGWLRHHVKMAIAEARLSTTAKDRNSYRPRHRKDVDFKGFLEQVYGEMHRQGISVGGVGPYQSYTSGEGL